MIERYINQIVNGNCVDVMDVFPANSIDMTITSPPYDNLRIYKGFSFPFDSVARQLFRITKEGGVVVWIVSDATIDGSETCTSFRQALKFVECGFNLHVGLLQLFYDLRLVRTPEKHVEPNLVRGGHS